MYFWLFYSLGSRNKFCHRQYIFTVFFFSFPVPETAKKPQAQSEFFAVVAATEILAGIHQKIAGQAEA